MDGAEVSLATLPVTGTYVHSDDGTPESDEMAEGRAGALADHGARRAGVLGEGHVRHQNSACKLRQEFTLQRLARLLDLGETE